MDFVTYKVENVTIFNPNSSESSVPAGTMLIHYKNTNHWNPVGIYVWSESGKPTGEWPGMEMTADSLNAGWFSYSLSNLSDGQKFKVIFNDKRDQGEKTNDSNDIEYQSGGEIWLEGGNGTVPAIVSKPKLSNVVFSTQSNADGTYSVQLSGNTFTNTKQPDLKLRLEKVNANNQKLAGAEFALLEAGDNWATAAKKTTDENGLVTFDIQRGTTYWLKETRAPTGYLTAGPWIIEVGSDGSAKLYQAVAGTDGGLTEKSGDPGQTLIDESTGTVITLTATICDQPMGYELPATGGTGTTWYTLGGLLITVVAAGLLVYNKKSRRGGVAFL